ncbi:ATP-binding cassette domain-containing protein [Brevibacillus humidisoli]|uniref:ABC transporter ATP-binding protein n=1 Tax=Brevibacillus humidisoli TaxID=2895522 RepID=UPI001E630D5A|nr:ATP-binding cassette domain-containing protein [Brevibacillus humidisoli]UFJ42477.1 ATP-binding cassette domain-containing protein [Brevibacillus humidisoli]
MIITTKNLCRDYVIYYGGTSFRNYFTRMFGMKGERKRVVDNLTMEIAEGEFVGYLGPNGAGKSTTIKMLSGVLTPTSGEIRALGLDPVKDRKKHAQNIGVLYGQRSQLWWDLPLTESFELLKAIYRIPDRDYKRRLNRFAEALHMGDTLKRPVRQLSLGERMKGEIVAALLHAPPIVFLDEPTIGLDIVSKNYIQEFLRMINREEKTTIILTSHNMDDTEKLCKRVILIDNGRVMFDGTQDSLRRLIQESKLLVVDVPVEQMGQTSPFKPAKVEENRLFFEFRDDSEVLPMLSALSNSYTILKVEIKDAQIEKVLQQLYLTKQYNAQHQQTEQAVRSEQ